MVPLGQKVNDNQSFSFCNPSSACCTIIPPHLVTARINHGESKLERYVAIIGYFSAIFGSVIIVNIGIISPTPNVSRNIPIIIKKSRTNTFLFWLKFNK